MHERRLILTSGWWELLRSAMGMVRIDDDGLGNGDGSFWCVHDIVVKFSQCLFELIGPVVVLLLTSLVDLVESGV